MRKLHRCGIFCFFMLFFLVCACGGKAMRDSYHAVNASAMGYGGSGADYRRAEIQSEAAMEEDYNASYTDGYAPAANNAATLEADLSMRKLVKRADLRLRVEDLAAVEKPLEVLLEKHGAWPAQTGIYENSRNYTIRVPSVSYEDMLTELAGLGKLIRRSENAEDVTLRYYDLESRLATKRELLKTYQGYLATAANIDEIMTVESRIADLQHEIDQTGTQFRNLANLVDYSTISVEFSGPAGASSYTEPTLKEKLDELFSSFESVASSAAVVLMGILMYGIPAILILILLFWILFGKIGILRRLIRLAAGKK